MTFKLAPGNRVWVLEAGESGIALLRVGHVNCFSLRRCPYRISGLLCGLTGKHWATNEAFLKVLRAGVIRPDRLMPTRIGCEGDRITDVGGFRRVGPVGASSTLAAGVGFGVLFALLVMLRAMVWKLRQTENRKGKKPMTNNNRKMFAGCTLETIWGVGISAASATLLARTRRPATL
jgi:hypothetical protein